MSYHEKPNTFVTNVEVKVSNLERSIAYYTQAIGFQVLQQTATTASLTADGKTALLTLIQPETPISPTQRKTGLFHFALLLPNRSDLAHVITHFRENGVQFGASDHDVSEAIYLQDPDNNGIEIYIDRPDEQWFWNGNTVHMVTEPLDINSILKETTGTWTGLPSNTVMGHIHLSVANLKDSEQFYTKGLGFDVVTRYGAQALFISTGKYHHHIGLNTWYSTNAPKLKKNEVGLSSFSLQLDNDEQAQQLKENLRALNAPVVELENGFQTEDPSGNTILLKFLE